MGKASKAGGDGLKPPPNDNRRHSYSGEGSRKTSAAATSSSNSGLSDTEKEKKRGLFGKLKDKAIGTKEEREAERRRAEEVCSTFMLCCELLTLR